ncbi:LOW QUALITY PROTEIN: hypothetical protein ACHAWF_005770 [Thalassiosira exigua]
MVAMFDHEKVDALIWGHARIRVIWACHSSEPSQALAYPGMLGSSSATGAGSLIEAVRRNGHALGPASTASQQASRGQGCPQCRSSWSGTTACGGAPSGRSSATAKIRVIDMGCPQLSMHSIRETMGARDFTHGLALFRAFFNDFSSVDSSIVN